MSLSLKLLHLPSSGYTIRKEKPRSLSGKTIVCFVAKKLSCKASTVLYDSGFLKGCYDICGSIEVIFFALILYWCKVV